MAALDGIYQGFAVALTLKGLAFCFIGVLLGTLVGVLPGIGPAGAISLLLPTTFRTDPASSMIMLAGLYYGVMYGGSIGELKLGWKASHMWVNGAWSTTPWGPVMRVPFAFTPKCWQPW